MPEPTLHERFARGGPTRDPQEKGRWVDDDEKRFILWGFTEGWSVDQIADALGISEWMVHQFHNRYQSDPRTLYELGLYEKKGDSFQCLVCSTELTDEPKAQNHLHDHLTTSIPNPESLGTPSLPEPDGNQNSISNQNPSRSDGPIQGSQKRVPEQQDALELLQHLMSGDKTSVGKPSQTQTSSSQKSESEQPSSEESALLGALTQLAERHDSTRDAENPDSADPVSRDFRQLQETDSTVSTLSNKASSASTQHLSNLSLRFRALLSALVDPVKNLSDSFRNRGGLTSGRDRKLIAGIFTSPAKEITTLTLEHNELKVLSMRGSEVMSYSITEFGLESYLAGLVQDTQKVARDLDQALTESAAPHTRLVAAVPGYQAAISNVELPNARELDPKAIFSREVARTLGIPAELATMNWTRLPGRSQIRRWLVVSATNRSVSSITDVVYRSGYKLDALELRPFAIARAVNRQEALVIWIADDGCDAIVIHNWVPIAYQSIHWESGSLRPSQITDRAVAVANRTTDIRDTLNSQVPVVTTGAHIGNRSEFASSIAGRLGRQTAEPNIQFDLPEGFPIHKMIVNVGLGLYPA